MPVTFMLVDGGAIDLVVNVSFQMCSETECLMPESVRFVLPISEQSLVERPKPQT